MLEAYNDVLMIKDIENILKISRNSAYKLVNNGVIKSLRVGRNIRIPKKYLIDYLLDVDYNDDSNMLCAPVSNRKEHGYDRERTSK